MPVAISPVTLWAVGTGRLLGDWANLKAWEASDMREPRHHAVLGEGCQRFCSAFL